MDPTCVSQGNCRSVDIVWKDGGPGFNESLYDGWLHVLIDGYNLKCINVSITKNLISYNIYQNMSEIFYNIVIIIKAALKKQETV